MMLYNEQDLIDGVKRGAKPEKPNTELRDTFAGFALQGILAGKHNRSKEAEEKFWEIRARCAYDAADAMLVAREK